MRPPFTPPAGFAVADAYRGVRQRVDALIADARADALTLPVPACPAWSVRELYAALPRHDLDDV